MGTTEINEGGLQPAADDSVLRVQSLSMDRGGRKVLQNVNLEVRSAQGPFAIIGESGSGKTTLLYCATGLLETYQGNISICGRTIKDLSAAERSSLVGLVFQDYQLFPHLSVRENIELAPRLSGIRKRGPSLETLLDSLGILELANRMPHELSGGQKQRVAIARSMVLEPRLLFLDEPSAALDEKTTLELAALLKDLSERTQIIVVSHDRQFVEACCDRGVRIVKGRATETRPVLELFQTAAS